MTLYDYVVAAFAIIGVAGVLCALILVVCVFIFVWKDLL